MAHSFDTALAAPQRTLILDGVIGLLSPLLVKNGGYLATVEPFGAVVRSYTDVDGIQMLYEALCGATPAIAVATGGRSSKSIGNGGFAYTCEIELLLYFATNNMRDKVRGRMAIDAAGAAANNADPGLHVMMEHAEQLVIGQYCGGASTTIKQVRPDREEELATREDLTLWLQTYQVTVTRNINRDRGVTALLESIHWRTTQQGGETHLPNAPIKPTTVDANSDDIGPT